MAISAGSAPLQPASDRLRRVVTYAVVLAAIARLPKDRRAQEIAITLAIGIAAAVVMARQSNARTLERLVAWDQRRHAKLPEAKAGA